MSCNQLELFPEALPVSSFVRYERDEAGYVRRMVYAVYRDGSIRRYIRDEC